MLYSRWMNLLLSVFLPILGYLFGSLPFAIWVTRYAKGIDIRETGSGHAGTTNTARQIGFGWGALVLVLDLAKGFIPVWLAIKYSSEVWVVALTATLAVVGHCWPLFAQFRGGMGLATFGGTLLAVNWLPFFYGLGVLIIILVFLRHRARASVFTGLLIAPFFWVLNLRGFEFWIALSSGLVIAYRFLMDWNRKYKGL